MALTIRFTQLARKKRKNGEIPIYLRFTENKKTKYLSTGISVKPEDWNPKKEEVRKSHLLAVKYNSELTSIKIKAESEKSDLRQEGGLDISSIKERLTFNSSKTIHEFGQEYLDLLRSDDRYWEHRHFKVILNDLNNMGSIDTQVARINQQFIELFRNYLLHTLGNANNTVRKKLQRLKSMVKEAMKQGYLSNDPFQFTEPLKRTIPTKSKLGIKQIRKIEELDLEKGSFIWHVRNYFLFSYYMAGIRFSDLCTLKPSNIVDGRLRYSMRKTGSEKNIKIQEEHFKILNHYNTKGDGYIFPLLEHIYKDEFVLKRKISSRNVTVNRALKELAKKANIDETISFHISRHSFAHNALKKGIDLYSISKALGHSDLKITEQYLKQFDEDMLDIAMEKFLQ